MTDDERADGGEAAGTDECPRCGGTGEVVEDANGYDATVPCPNCAADDVNVENIADVSIPLRPGGIAADREDDDSVLVTLFRHGSSAEDYRIAATGKSVAEHNPEYAADSPVWVCAYRGTIEEAFGDKWRNWSTERLAFEVGNRGCRTYSFPAPRLDAKPHGWSPDDGGDEQTDDIREYL